MANHLIIPGLLFLAFYFFSSPATSSSNETDLSALLAIRDSITDPRGALSSWNKTIHFCGWKGVFCGKKHPNRVVVINLMSQGLSGSLSPHVGNLSFLRRVTLSNNSFHGQIPETIGRLRRLEYIRLTNNSFGGTIPRNLSQCSNLQLITMINNNLIGTIPRELGSLYKLSLLNLRGNNELSGTIPPSIGNLTALKALDLFDCGLQGEIPDSIAQLGSLTFLSLGRNRLSGSVPLGLYEISTLSTLDLQSNQLHGVIPPDIGFTLPNLEFFGLLDNKFTGLLPLSLSNASLLQQIDFSDNDFVGPMLKDLGKLSKLKLFDVSFNHIQDDISFVSSLINCTSLGTLLLHVNLISGSLPDSIANFSSQFYRLNLADNQIHGNLPSSIEYLSNLVVLDTSNNKFDGQIPSGIVKLSKLQRVDMSGNRFTNELPPLIGNLTLLIVLYLDNNNISGSIPPSLGNLTQLSKLNLSHNNFSGSIPHEVMRMSSISIFFDLSYNALTGPIPLEVGAMTQLGELDLSNNKLSGHVPDSLSSCTSLLKLYLQGNFLEGELPEGLNGLKALQVLDLSRNNFSGSIPSFLSELNLANLNLSFNKLQGQVPVAGIFTNKTAVSLDGNNALCGGILELNLPRCPNPKKRNLSAILKILIPTALCGIIFVSLLVYFYMKRKMSKNNVASPESLDPRFLRLSYTDILKAVDGFSDANIVGSGRFGSVYKGILDDGVTSVAVKVLNLHVRGASKSFVVECTALRGIRHRNLLRIVSVCSSTDFRGNDFKALVYEYQANGSLDKWLHQEEEQDSIQDEQVRYLTVIQRLNIAIDVASGIEYLHSGTDSVFVHGDLKPSNILLDEDMTARIGDFGLTKIISSISSDHPPHGSSSSIGIKGTIGYIAPEYGMSNLVSMQGDVYSYGIILLEMFTNKRPIDGAFKDHSNLHDFVSHALPDSVAEIVDPLILQKEHDIDSKMEFMVSTFRIGLACSQDIQRNRMSVGDAIQELRKIRDAYLVSRM